MKSIRFIFALAMTVGLLFSLSAQAQPAHPKSVGANVTKPEVVVVRPTGGPAKPGDPLDPKPLPPTSQPASKGPAVICAVYYQPSTNFAMVKARGVNALMGYDYGANNSMDAWCAAAQQAGLFYYLQCYQTVTPGAAPAVLPLALEPVAIAHQNDANLLGYLLPDEPNGAGNLTPDQCVALYAACKAAAPKVPVIQNLDGSRVLQGGVAQTKPYLAACDVCCFDHYPENYGTWDIPNLKVIAADLKTWSGGKPVIEILEAADMNIKVQAWCVGTPLAAKMRGPTGAQMKEEVLSGHQGGISAICWFQDRIGLGFEGYDGTTADEQAAMLAIDTALQAGKW